MRFATGLAPRRRTFCSTCTSRWGRPSSAVLARVPFDVHPEVAAAQAEGKPVVALESTLITHGLPPPASSDLPKECEALLRARGVTPATIAIIGGRIKVGLTSGQLDELAEKGWEAKKHGTGKLWKVGRRELGAALVKSLDGGTTVSATMAIAHLAGIKIFSTGGIGGVHRGAELSFDISSDLQSLADTPVAVVCAGSKSILDIGLTLEYLEAHAVPVAAFGTSDWPAFYTPRSGFAAPMRLDSAREVAETIVMSDRLGLPSSLLLGVPIPEAFHAAGEALQEAVEMAVTESVANGMSKSGKAVTPWLLQRVSELTKGSSVESNKALILNNVRVGAEVAIEHARLLKNSSESSAITSSFQPAMPSPAPVESRLAPSTSLAPAPLVVIGSLAIDITLSPSSVSPLSTTAPGRVSMSLGGVAGNVAGAASSLGLPSDTVLLAPAAGDALGTLARAGLEKRGMRTDGLLTIGDEENGTPACGILLDERGDLIGGVADMGLASKMTGTQIVDVLEKVKSRLVCFDGNISSEAMSAVLDQCQRAGTETLFETTSNAQSLKVVSALSTPLLGSQHVAPEQPLVTYTAPNIHELATLYNHVRGLRTPSDEPDLRFAHGLWFDYITVQGDLLARRLPEWVVSEGIVPMAVSLLPIFRTLFVKSGARGVVVVQRVSGAAAVEAWQAEARRLNKGVLVAAATAGPEEAVVVRHYPALELTEGEVKSVTGAGDNLAGAVLVAMTNGLSVRVPSELDQIVDIGQRAAVQTLKSHEAVGDHSKLKALLPAPR